MMNGQNNHRQDGQNGNNNHNNNKALDGFERYHSQDDRHFVAMYQRAVVEQDAQARAWLQSQTLRTMYYSLRNHPFYERIPRRQHEEYYISQAYEQFWQASETHCLLSSRQAVMHSLHALLNGVLLEAARPSTPHTPHTQPVRANEQVDSHQLWATIRSTLPEAREQRIAYLLYHCGLKPSEIMRAYPQEFSDLQEISRVRRVVLERFNASM